MNSPSGPSFHEWVEYYFTKARDDLRSYGEDLGEAAADARDKRVARFDRIPTKTRLGFMTELFSSPTHVAETYSEEQIADGIWRLFNGISSFHDWGPKNQALQLGCVRAVATMYTDLFDKVCGRRGAEPDECLYNSSPVDIAVYMIWDMDGIQYFSYGDRNRPSRREAQLAVLKTALLRCRTSSCRMSALHGIGHLVYSAGPPMRVQLEALVDEFLKLTNVPDWLREYAGDARSGMVQ